MPSRIAPNIVQVEWLYTLDAQQCENRLMVDILAEPDPADLETLAIAAWNWWEETYSPFITSQCLLRAVVATSLHTADAPQFTYAPDATTTGGDTGDAMPNEVSLCVSLRSAARGRSARGRWYVAGLPRAAMNGTNTVFPTTASSYASALSTLFATINGDGHTPVIVSFFSGGVLRPGGPVYYGIESAVVIDNIVDSMRRRKPGVGS